MEPRAKEMDAFDIELAEASGQRSQAWRDVRAGKFTASEMWKLMGEPRSKAAKEAGGWSDEASTYINTKVAEEITGHCDQARSAAIEWGEDLEPVAKEHFTVVTGMQVKYLGFKMFNPHAGGSPDGFVDDPEFMEIKSLIEIKCPYNSGNQVEYLKLFMGNQIKEDYPKFWWQMQANMLFNSMGKCYFVTFDPRFPEKQKMKIVEVYADLDDQNKMVKKLMLAIEEKLRIIKLLT